MNKNKREVKAMFFNTKIISDLATMLEHLSSPTSGNIIVKGYKNLVDAATKPDTPDAVFFYDGEDYEDGCQLWTVWDFNPAQPCGTNDIDGFFNGCTILGVQINTKFDGETVNAIVVYQNL